VTDLCLQSVVVHVNIWLKYFLNLSKRRENGQKDSLLAVERARIVALHMERLPEGRHEKTGSPRRTSRKDDHAIRRAVV